MSDNRNMVVRVDSTRGYSAYEIAVQHGYTGTEAEWIAATQGLPSHYIKTAVISGNTLVLTRQDGTLVSFVDENADWDNITNKPASFQPASHTHTAAECHALPSTTTIPTKTSDLTNDSGYITEASMPAYGIYYKNATVVAAASASGKVEITPGIDEEVTGTWEYVGPVAAVVAGDNGIVKNWHMLSTGKMCVHYTNLNASQESILIKAYCLFKRSASAT